MEGACAPAKIGNGGGASNVMSFVMRRPIATLASGNSGFAAINAALQSGAGTGTVRRGMFMPSKILPIISL
jgi:hypothetical protein